MAYPIVLNLEGRLCAVIGAGKVANRKITALLQAGAVVQVVGISPTTHIQELAEQEKILYHRRGFVASDLDGCSIAFAATNDVHVNQEVGKVAREKDVLFCDSSGGESDFSVPAVYQQDDLTIAISTGGSSPGYARLVRDGVKAHLSESHGEVLNLLKETRAHLKQHVLDPNARQKIWRSLLSSGLFEEVQAGKLADVKKRISQCL